MADFNQTQDELAQYLENQFGGQDNERDDEQDPDKNPEMLNQYLENDTSDNSSPSAYTPYDSAPQAAPQADPQQLANERVLQLERELAATQARSQLFESALSQQAAPQQPVRQRPMLFDQEELTVDPRYETDYGDANPYITAIAKNVAMQMYEKAVAPLQQRFNEMQQQMQYQQQFNATQRGESMYMQLRAMHPDVDELARSAEWQSYIQQGDAYGGTYTLAQHVQDGIQSGNLKKVSAIIDGFKKARGIGTSPKQTAPGRSQTTLPPTAVTGRGKTLTMSSFERATNDFQNGKISYDVYQKITDEFNTAAMEGRVNYNK